ncbi:MAG: hypothetical protein K8R92_00790 [Planctomycetes bacterium]|nr:hypothetical protein [Planctomycetota bacterium]
MNPTATSIDIQLIFSGIQTLVYLGSIAGVFMVLGRKDEALKNNTKNIAELAELVKEVSHSVGSLDGNHKEHAARLDGIHHRLSRLEQESNAS